MKRSAIIFLCVLSLMGYTQNSSTTFSPPKKTCEEYKSLYYQYLTMKMYQDARHFWLQAFDVCKGTKNLDDRFFVNGNIIYNGLAENTFIKDSIHQKEVIDSLSWIYEEHLKINTSPELKLRYAVHLMDKKDTSFAKISELFGAVHELKAKTTARQLCLYFKNRLKNELYYFKGERHEAFKYIMLEDYLRLIAYADAAIKAASAAKNETKIHRYKEAKTYLDKIMLIAVESCESLNAVLHEKYERDTLSISEVETCLELMKALKCKPAETYNRYMNLLLVSRPSSKGYAELGNLEFTQEHYAEAIAAYQKALDLTEVDSIQHKTRYFLALSFYEAKQFQKAFDAAQKVEGTFRGKAMILCGNCIVALAEKCGESTFLRKANFWLANDYYVKALKLGEKVDKSSFLDRAPTEQECFYISIKKGEKVMISCWKESTIVRY